MEKFLFHYDKLDSTYFFQRYFRQLDIDLLELTNRMIERRWAGTLAGTRVNNYKSLVFSLLSI